MEEPLRAGETAGDENSADLRVMVESYLEAIQACDLDRCMAFYAENATIHFLNGVFRGRSAIADWHKQRFAAEPRVVRVDSLQVSGNLAIVDAAVTSKRLMAWRISSVAGRVRFEIENGKIKVMKMSPRLKNPFEKM